MAREAFANNAITTLAAPYVAASGQIVVVDASRFPQTDQTPYRVLLDNPEKTVFKVTNNNGSPADTTWFGVAESDDADADAGTTVTHVISAGTFDAIKKDQSTRASFFTNGEFGQAPFKEGILHFFTDSPLFGRDKGTGPASGSVDLYYGLVRAGMLKPGIYSALNTGTSVFSSSGATAEIRTLGDNPAEGIRGRYEAAPLTAFVRRLGLLAAPPASGLVRAGMFLMESVTGKIITFGLVSSVADGMRMAEVTYWDDETTINVINFEHPAVKTLPIPMWYKVERSGSDLIFSMSKDGYFYEVVETSALTAFFTTEPDRVGFFAENETLTDDFRTTFVSWETV